VSQSGKTAYIAAKNEEAPWWARSRMPQQRRIIQ